MPSKPPAEQNEPAGRQLTRLMDRAETLGRNLHADGRRNNPIRGSFLDELRASADKAYRLGRELHGSDFAATAGPDDICGCAFGITWFEGRWVHIANPQLLHGDDHDAEPADGHYEPEETQR